MAADLVRKDKLPLQTLGRYIVNREHVRVKWACINWAGAYEASHVVGGLEAQPLRDLARRISELGFNCVRLCYSTEAYIEDPVIAETYLAANPELVGLRFRQVFDLVVEALTDEGLMVIINNHISVSGWCCTTLQDEGLWHVPRYNESLWIQSLTGLTRRYRGNPLVVAFDLRNEPHDTRERQLSWGDGNLETDWAAAAERAGNAVLAENPDVLIVISAICFCMDLRPLKMHQIKLALPDRIVYEVHNYIEFQIFTLLTYKINFSRTTMENLYASIAALLVMLILALHVAWTRLEKPCPPTGVLRMTLGFWLGLTNLVAAAVYYILFNFFRLYCNYYAWTFDEPLCLLHACLTLAFAALGAWGYRAYRRHARGGGASPGNGRGFELDVRLLQPPPWRAAANPAADTAAVLAAAGAGAAAEEDEEDEDEEEDEDCFGHAANGHTAVAAEEEEDCFGHAANGHTAVAAEEEDCFGHAANGHAAVAAAPSTSNVTSCRGEQEQEEDDEEEKKYEEAEAAAGPPSWRRRRLPPPRLPLAMSPPQQQEEPRRRRRRADHIASRWSSCRVAWGRLVGDGRRVTLSPSSPLDPRALMDDWDRGLCCGLQLAVASAILAVVFGCLTIAVSLADSYAYLQSTFDWKWGFALQEGYPFTAPVWMGEFGQNARGRYWMHLLKYLSVRDVDFAYWTLNGRKLVEGEFDEQGKWQPYDTPRWEQESFGLLADDYRTVRHPWKLLDLQAIMSSPAGWVPDSYPCDRDVLGSACGG